MRILKSLLFAPLRQLCTGTGLSPVALIGEKLASPLIESRSPRGSETKARNEILPEAVFHRILRWEQHKTQRSQKSFVLLLMDMKKIVRTGRGEALAEILRVITSATRGADIAGWYRESLVIGIIFTGSQTTDRTLLQRFICGKLNTLLQTRVAPELVKEIHYSLYIFPEDWEKVKSENAPEVRMLERFVGSRAGMAARLMKRASDIVGSVVALILFAPLFVVIPLLIKLTSDGPVLFGQERVGQYGRRFRFLKFRSMVHASDATIHRDFVKRFIAGTIDSLAPAECGTVLYKIQQDARVTPLGRLLRKTSLDELPQLFNVLKGDMSLVGPRPPIPYEVESYQKWHLQRLLEAKPGITGLWQVKGRSRTTFDEMVRLDLHYARTWSVWLDFLILLQTPRAVLSGIGAF